MLKLDVVLLFDIISPNDVLKIGHRGACGYEPENTLASFKKALELKVDMIELDVYLCSTGEIVVIHDNRVDRTTDGTGYVKDKSLKELRNLDAGNGEKIPLLGEALDLIDRKAVVNIELKGEGAVRPVTGLIEKYIAVQGWSIDDFLVSSFNHYELVEVKEICPDLKIGANIKAVPIGYCDFAERIGAYSVHPSFEFINDDFVDDAHRRGLKIYCWTVDDPEDIKRAAALNVDGIFSNFPDRLDKIKR